MALACPDACKAEALRWAGAAVADWLSAALTVSERNAKMIFMAVSEVF
jgi:hypothetical protein